MEKIKIDEIENGDVCLVSRIIDLKSMLKNPKGTYFSWAIQRKLRRHDWGNPLNINHVDFYLSHNFYTFEYNSRHKTPVDEFFEGGKRYYIARAKCLRYFRFEDAGIKAFSDALDSGLECEDTRYDFGLIIRLAWHLTFKRMERLAFDLEDVRMICSEYAQLLLKAFIENGRFEKMDDEIEEKKAKEESGRFLRVLRETLFLPNMFCEERLFDVYEVEL